jgi:hypothetical protein
LAVLSPRIEDSFVGIASMLSIMTQGKSFYY